jgi:phosphosulfolactate synthase
VKREVGLTEVIDLGIGFNATEDLVTLCGDYVDIVRLAGAMSVLYRPDVLKKKIDLLRSANIRVCSGGIIYERYVRDNGLENLDKDFIDEYILPQGFDIVEIATPLLHPSEKDILTATKKIASRNMTVAVEVGFKVPSEDKAFTVDKRVELMKHALEAGATFLKVEGRESGVDIGIFDANGNVMKEMLLEYFEGFDKLNVPPEKIIWEAPLKNQQHNLIKFLGPNVNLGNISHDRVLLLEGYRQGVKYETAHLVHDGGKLKHGREFLQQKTGCLGKGR